MTNTQEIIEQLHASQYAFLREADLKEKGSIQLTRETIRYDDMLHALHAMFGRRIYPKYLFLSEMVRANLRAEMAFPEMDAIGMSDFIDGKLLEHMMQFVVLTSLDEHTVIFGFFE